MVDEESIQLFRVKPGAKMKLSSYDPDWVGGKEMQKLGEGLVRQRAMELLEKERGVLAEAQDKLYAGNAYAVLLVLLGMAGAGMNEVVKHVMTGVNPQGCQAKMFAKPSAEELDHDFLWRYTKALPERGRIGIFNGSYYDEVIECRVNADTESKEPTNKAFWRERYKSIKNFEDHLIRNGVVILKVYLHISPVEQKKRLLEMIEDPAQWRRFPPDALEQHKTWDRYVEAYEEAISATSTEIVPWYVIPADHLWAANAMAADILTDVILGLGVDYPKISEEKLKDLQAAKTKLENEPED